MDLNYHHLRYFWAVARTGSIAKACEQLHVAQPTISGQLRDLERVVGEPLFERRSKGLALTDTGRMVLGYCDEIFAIGKDLAAALSGRGSNAQVTVVVGISDSLPKVAAYRLLEPAMKLEDPVRLICVEDRPERLHAELAAHRLDVVLSDAPIGPEAPVRAFNHLLGESGVGIFAAPALVHLAQGFPQSLTGQPFLLPTAEAGMRRDLDAWLDREGVNPRIVAELQDSALATTFGAHGAGVFAGHMALRDEIAKQFQVECIGTCEGLRERYYAISVERRLSNPAVVAITRGARKLLRGR